MVRLFQLEALPAKRALVASNCPSGRCITLKLPITMDGGSFVPGVVAAPFCSVKVSPPDNEEHVVARGWRAIADAAALFLPDRLLQHPWVMLS
jgi:hypothetical protein